MNNLLVFILPTCLIIKALVGFIEQINYKIYSMNFEKSGCDEVVRFYLWHNWSNLINKLINVQIPIWTAISVYQFYLICW